jgi:3-hydroxyisobutyrate dehydrogenase-like beta-hydroxyacid dehydrogenase
VVELAYTRPGVTQRLAVAVLGLGEAGTAIADGLRSGGAEVRGWDPRPDAGNGLRMARDPQHAVRGADVVLSVNQAAVAVDAARSVFDALASGQVYADLNSAGAPLKLELASLIAPSGALFADVALMAPVPWHGVRTPALVSGPGAEEFAERMRPFGMPVDVVGKEPGQAAVRKLLRSVFMKGLAGVAIESLSAAAAAGCEDWLRAEIVSVLESADAALLERLETGSRKHAVRRAHEVDEAAALLRELGVEPRIADATADLLRGLADDA